jgi:hypothetical protein
VHRAFLQLLMVGSWKSVVFLAFLVMAASLFRPGMLWRPHGKRTTCFASVNRDFLTAHPG